LTLPQDLSWIEVDLPAILTEKEQLLAGETPRCRLERVKLDLADVTARRALFARIGAGARNVLVVCEGLLVYLSEGDVAALARDLSSVETFRRWLTDLMSPALFKMLQRQYAGELDSTPFQFAPAAGPRFFEAHGWRPIETHSFMKEAARVGRLNPFMRLLAMLPDSKGIGPRPWGGAVLLERKPG